MKLITVILLSVFSLPLFAGSIQVTAATEQQVAPDRALISVQFKIVDKDSVKAKQRVNQQVNQLFDALASNTQLSSNHFLKLTQNQGDEWSWNKGERQRKGYFSSVGLQIIVVNLAQLDQSYAQIAAFKHAKIIATDFTISKRFEYEQQLLKQALKKAKDKASLMAATYQQTLGKALTIKEHQQTNEMSRPPMMARMQSTESAANLAGEVAPITVKVNLFVEFDLQ